MKTIAQLAPAALEEITRALSAVDETEVAVLRARVEGAGRVFLSGRGRSGLQLSGFAMRLMHLGFPAHMVGEVTAPAIMPGDLLVLGSGSGRTSSLVSHAEFARQLGVPRVLITAAPTSPLIERVDAVIRISASTPKNETTGHPRSILPMGSLFEQAMGILLDLVVVQLMESRSVTWQEMFARHANLE